MCLWAITQVFLPFIPSGVNTNPKPSMRSPTDLRNTAAYPECGTGRKPVGVATPSQLLPWPHLPLAANAARPPWPNGPTESSQGLSVAMPWVNARLAWCPEGAPETVPHPTLDVSRHPLTAIVALQATVIFPTLPRASLRSALGYILMARWATLGCMLSALWADLNQLATCCPARHSSHHCLTN